MKKILLAAVALLFTVGATAQNFNLRSTSGMMPVSVSTTPSDAAIPTKGFDVLSVAKKASKTVMKAAEMPEGEQREYYIERYDYVGGVSDSTKFLYERVTKETVVFGDDGTVYIPNILAGMYLDEPGWITGKLSDDGGTISIEQDQVLGTYQGMNCTLSAFDQNGYLVEGPVTFTIDSEYGIAMMNGGLMMMVTFMGQSGFLTQCSSIYMYPADNKELFAAPVTRNVTASMTTVDGTTPVTYTVEDVESSILGMHFVKGLLSKYPDSWFVVMNADQQSNDLVMLGQVISNDLMAVVYNQQNINEGPEVVTDTRALFTHNSDGSYTFASNNYIADYAVRSYDQETQTYEYGNSCIYTDITLGIGTSGISSVETGKGEPVATEYYDLSGRRVDAAAKGVTIRVEKYADGTSKAVKTIK